MASRQREKTPLQILKDARTLLIPAYKWVKGHFYEKRRHRGKTIYCYCTLGALEAAGTGRKKVTNWRGVAFYRAENILWEVVGGDITDWNDDPQRTHAQVIKAFDKAIAKAAKAQEAAGD